MKRQSEWVRAYLEALVSDDCWVIRRLGAGGEWFPDSANVSVTVAMALFCEVEELTVQVRHPEYGTSFLWFVWQGPDDTYPDGDEVLADYGVLLDPWLIPVMKLAA